MPGHPHAGVSLTLDWRESLPVDRLGVDSPAWLRRDGVEIRCRYGAVASVPDTGSAPHHFLHGGKR